MPSKQRPRAAVALPKGVHKVTSRGHEYYYFQAGRGTSAPGPRIKIEHDPQTPEFWAAVMTAQGKSKLPTTNTVGLIIDQYLAAVAPTITKITLYHYGRSLEFAKRAWGNLPIEGLRPAHIQELMDGMATTPSKANHFLSTMKSLSGWARVKDYIAHSLTEGVRAHKITGGHKPWTDAQIAAAQANLSGMIRRGFMLYLYTGQRGQDVVRLGWNHVDDGGFNLVQKKTGVDVWCPIVPELAAEMATWEKQPGPFLRQPNGAAYERKSFWRHFTEAIENIPELGDVTLHGLRCTAVIRLRREGLSTGQIGDIVGMSLGTINRYCRFADRKSSGKAALIQISDRQNERKQKDGFGT
jgi:integrase